MPTIAWVSGIAIRMFFNDHAPPHFHAFHAGKDAKFDIASGRMIGGVMPRAEQRLVARWISCYRSELMAAWDAVRSDKAPERIPNLEADNDN